MVNFCRLFLWLVAQMPRVVKARLPSSDLSGMADNDGAPVKKSVYEGLARLVGETFMPLPLDLRGILFRADFPGEEFLPGHDIGGGWGKLFSGGLEIVQGTGNYVTMLLEPNIVALGQHLDDALDCERDRLLERFDVVPRRVVSGQRAR